MGTAQEEKVLWTNDAAYQLQSHCSSSARLQTYTPDTWMPLHLRTKELKVWGTTSQQPHLQNVLFLLKLSQLIFAGSPIFPGTVIR